MPAALAQCGWRIRSNPGCGQTDSHAHAAFGTSQGATLPQPPAWANRGRRQSAGLAADRLVMEPSFLHLLACFAVSLASSGHRTS